MIGGKVEQRPTSCPDCSSTTIPAGWQPTPAHLRQIARIERRLAVWQQRMPILHNWTFRVVPVPAGCTPCGAALEYYEFPRHAVLKVEPRIVVDEQTGFAAGRNSIDWVVAHELSHMLLNRLRQVTQAIVNNLPDNRILIDAWMHAEEETVWNLADILAKIR